MQTATLTSETGSDQIGDTVTTGLFLRSSDATIGPASIIGIGDAWEVFFACRNARGLRCTRTAGLFADLDSIPHWIWDAR